MDKFDIFLFEQHCRNGIYQWESEGNTVTMSEERDNYTVFMEPQMPDMVCEQKIYDANTLMLTTEGKCLKQGGVRIGVWKSYDQCGEVLEENDYEEGWKIGWKDLLPILADYGIHMDQVMGIERYVDEGEDNESNENEEESVNDLEEVDDFVNVEDLEEEPEEGEDEGQDEPEEDPFEFLRSIAMEEGQDNVELKTSGRYWVITVMLSNSVAKEYTFDGETGSKLWDNYLELR